MAEPSKTVNYVVLSVWGGGKETIPYKIAKHSRLQKLMDSHRTTYNLQREDVEFVTSSGHKLCEDDTVLSLNLQTGDRIELINKG